MPATNHAARRTSWGFLILFLSCCMTTGTASDKAGTNATLADLSWFAGTWRRTTQKSATTEMWMAPEGRTMLGASRTVSNEVTVEHEFLMLKEEAGTIRYIATPSHQKQASFTLISLSPTNAIFENLEHDFPQRIIYHKDGPNSILAVVEGTRNGKPRRVEFNYRRVAAP